MLKLTSLKDDLDELSKSVSNISARVEKIYDEENDACNALDFTNFSNAYITSKMGDAILHLDSAMTDINDLLPEIDELESIYFSTFMANYNPLAVIEKIDELRESIQGCQNDLEEAAK